MPGTKLHTALKSYKCNENILKHWNLFHEILTSLDKPTFDNQTQTGGYKGWSSRKSFLLVVQLAISLSTKILYRLQKPARLVHVQRCFEILILYNCNRVYCEEVHSLKKSEICIYILASFLQYTLVSGNLWFSDGTIMCTSSKSTFLIKYVVFMV